MNHSEEQEDKIKSNCHDDFLIGLSKLISLAEEAYLDDKKKFNEEKESGCCD